MYRIGIGYDNHRLEAGRDLVLGGVRFEAPVGADAHSDGDVVLHALVDAILGALAEGDIGTHFPDTDPRWKGQPSRLFLEHAARLAVERGYRLVNVDTTIVLQFVRIGDRRTEVAESIRSILAPISPLDADAISVKAKTNERCDAVGEGRAVVAQAAVLLEKVASAER